MFKSAATKIAHNSTIPSLGGNKDLRPLQDLITAEKAVLISLQKLSVDFAKAAEALRVWGSGEGDDLGDILAASTTLLTLYSTALSQYASHGHPMREHLKSIRTREENLDDFKRRRKAVGSKAESVERKLNKMSPEHKNLQMQTDSLNALRAEIRSMDSEIMSEEAYLGDFKRSTTRAWMGLKFGGLLECSEKGTIAGEYGKLIISEIPEEQTQPGMARSSYYGHAKVQQLVSEAHHGIDDVVMSTVPSAPPHHVNPLQQMPLHHTPQQSYQSSPVLGMRTSGGPPPAEWSPRNSHDMTPSAGPPNYLPPAHGFGTGQFLDQPSSPTSGPGSPTQQHHGPPQSQHPATTPYLPEIQSYESAPRRSLDEFGVQSGPSGPIDQSGTGNSGRFATFPVRARPPGMVGYSLSDPPSLNTRHEAHDSFSSSVAQALRSSQSPPGDGPTGFDRPAPVYSSFTAPQGPPPGAQQGLAPGWGTSLHHNPQNISADEETTLAYMSNADETPQDGYFAGPGQHHEDRAGKHVSFGEVNAGEAERPSGNDITQPQQYNQPPPQNRSSADSAEANSELSPPQGNQTGGGSGDNSPTADTRFQNQRRVPPPSVDPAEDERALNAAAAREVSRELDALHFDPPVLTNRGTGDPPPFQDANPDYGHAPPQSDVGFSAPPPVASENIPLAPPSAPFTRRTPSPHRSTSIPSSTYSGGSPYHSPPQGYTQPHPLAQATQEPSQYNQPPQPPPHDGPHTPVTSNPPRLNTTITPLNLSDQPRFSPSLASHSPSPYQTPLEYPRGLGLANSSPMTKSSTSLNTQLPPGTRTISAAAFKRPPPRMASGSGDLPPSLADTSPLTLKKRLPSSPYPHQREGSPMARDRERSGSLPPSQPPPTHALPPVPTEDEDYDYLSAYVNTGSTPPDAGGLGQRGAGEARGRQGYAEGRFATDLEGGEIVISYFVSLSRSFSLFAPRIMSCI